MDEIVTSKLTTKCQATIPEKIRGVLGLHPGDSVAFEILEDQRVYIHKATPVELEFARTLDGTLASESLSENDKEAYSDL